LDHYSLVLQLIQVFPVVSQAAILMVATTWFARALSGSCLIAASIWVVYKERARMRRLARTKHSGAVDASNSPTLSLGSVVSTSVTAEPADSAKPGGSMPPPGEAAIVHDDGIIHTEVTHHDGKIHIAVSLHLRNPDPPPVRDRRQARVRRQVRHRAARTRS